jgi:multidrug resistance efflux pump
VATEEEAEMEIIIGVFWLALSFVIAGLASSRGRSSIGWWVVALLISPLLAGVLVFVLPDLKAAQEKKEADQRSATERAQEAQTRKAEENEAARQITGQLVAEELRKLANLRKMNIVDDTELDSQKTAFYQRLADRSTKESLGDFFMPIGKLAESGEINRGDLDQLKAIFAKISRQAESSTSSK